MKKQYNNTLNSYLSSYIHRLLAASYERKILSNRNDRVLMKNIAKITVYYKSLRFLSHLIDRIESFRTTD